MTRQKKIQKEIEVESFIYHFIRRAGELLIIGLMTIGYFRRWRILANAH